MKKRFLIIIAIVAVLVSCKKSELNLFPYNALETSQVFNTEKDVENAVNGIYTGLRVYYSATSWTIIGDVLTDNLITVQAGRGTLRSFANWQYNGLTNNPTASGNTSTNFFANGYTVTRRSNAILENVDKLSNAAFKNNAKGEALATRALVYLDMARFYSKIPVNATAADLTIPFVTTTDPTIKPSKETVSGFYQKIVADLLTAETLINASNGTGRLNKAGVQALLSRVYLYMGDYASTITKANAVLGATPNLPNIANFPSVWTDQTEAGVLFKVKVTNTDGTTTPGVQYNQTVANGIRSEYAVEYNLAQAFKANDVRTAAYIVTSPYNGVNYNHVVKYRTRPGSPAGNVDLKVLRTAEVLLNRAEAYYRSGNETAALADLNLLKSNRYTGFVPVPLAGVALLNEILNERRLELAFENDRFYDLKRRNAGIQRDGTKGDRADGSGTTYLFTTMAATDFRFQMPIPQSEINFNSNFAQNPGY